MEIVTRCHKSNDQEEMGVLHDSLIRAEESQSWKEEDSCVYFMLVFLEIHEILITIIEMNRTKSTSTE